MSTTPIFTIAGEAMRLEKLRIDMVANNIAHEHTIMTPNGTPYKAQQVVATASSFEDFLNGSTAPFSEITYVSEDLPPNKVYEPNHPFADKDGFIQYPGINKVDEMTTLLSAERSYEANLKLVNTAYRLTLQTLHLGEEK